MSTLEYTNEGNSNLPLLFGSVDRVIIYFEDKGQDSFYETILERLLKIEDLELQTNIVVKTLNGKGDVLSLYKQLKDENALANSYFVVDADFDLVLGRTENDQTGRLIYLRRYNIESYLVDENSFINAVVPVLNKKKSEAKRIVKFPQWLSQINNGLFRLFLLFIIANKSDICNVRLGCGRFIDDKGEVISSEYDSYKEFLARQISNLDDEINAVEKVIYRIFGNEHNSIICGKYLIHAAYRYLHTFGKCTLSKKYFIFILLNHFDSNSLNYLLAQIQDEVKIRT